MALSHRFSLIQAAAPVDDEEETSEEYKILQKRLGKSLSVKCSTPFALTSGMFDARDDDADEKEVIDPAWKVEFQAIMRKCKLKQTISFNRNLALEGIIDEDIGYNDREKIPEVGPMENGKNSVDTSVFDPECVSNIIKTEHDLKCDKQEQEHKENISAEDTNIEEMIDYSSDDNTHKSNLVKSEANMVTQEVSSIIKNRPCLQNENTEETVEEVPDVANVIPTEATLKCSSNQEEDPVQKDITKPSLPSITPVHSKQASTGTTVKKHVENSLNKNSKQQDNIEPAKPKETVHSKAPKQKPKEAKCSKSVIKVIPATSFPLDELLPKSFPLDDLLPKSFPLDDLLPKEPIKQHHVTSPVSKHNKPSEPNDTEHAYKTGVSPYQYEPYMTDYPDSVFHGEIYTSPFSDDSEHKYSTNLSPSISEPCGMKRADNRECTVGSFETQNTHSETNNSTIGQGFSFLMDAIHGGNSAFVEHLQNALSQHLGSNQPSPVKTDDRHAEECVLPETLPSTGDKTAYGFYSELNSSTMPDSEKLQNIHDYCQEQKKKGQSNVSEKGDSLDKQSEELFKLFILQCSQLVKTNEDEKMLSSLVSVLKKESGSTLHETGFTPPGPSDRSDSSVSSGRKISQSDFKASDSESGLELFEGRTLLKGGVHPRHIPKTNTGKCGKDKPKDPRSVSTLLAKTVHKPLPLPRFIHNLYDETTVQRILTLDWDSKRVHFNDQATRSVTKDKEQNIVPSYNPARDLLKVSNRGTNNSNIEVSCKETEARVTDKDVITEEEEGFPIICLDKTPVKDEVKKSINEDRMPNDGRIYGKIKTYEGMDTISKDDNQTEPPLKDDVISKDRPDKRGLKHYLVEEPDYVTGTQQKDVFVEKSPKDRAKDSSKFDNGILSKASSLESVNCSGKLKLSSIEAKVTPPHKVNKEDSQNCVKPQTKCIESVNKSKQRESDKGLGSSTKKSDKHDKQFLSVDNKSVKENTRIRHSNSESKSIQTPGKSVNRTPSCIPSHQLASKVKTVTEDTKYFTKKTGTAKLSHEKPVKKPVVILISDDDSDKAGAEIHRKVTSTQSEVKATPSKVRSTPSKKSSQGIIKSPTDRKLVKFTFNDKSNPSTSTQNVPDTSIKQKGKTHENVTSTSKSSESKLEKKVTLDTSKSHQHKQLGTDTPKTKSKSTSKKISPDMFKENKDKRQDSIAQRKKSCESTPVKHFTPDNLVKYQDKTYPTVVSKSKSSDSTQDWAYLSSGHQHKKNETVTPAKKVSTDTHCKNVSADTHGKKVSTDTHGKKVSSDSSKKRQDKKLETVTPKSKSCESTSSKKVSPDIFEKIKTFKNKMLSPAKGKSELEAGELKDSEYGRETVYRGRATSSYSDCSNNTNICVSRCSSDLEEGQIMSDSGSDLDMKRSESENLIRISLIRSRQYRERRRHNSSSSEESVHSVDDRDKRQTHGHKSSTSISTKTKVGRSLSLTECSDSYRETTGFVNESRKHQQRIHDDRPVEKLNVARSSSDVRQSKSHSNDAELLKGSRKRHHTVHVDRHSSLEKANEARNSNTTRQSESHGLNVGSRKESRKRHHTVHDERESSVEKKSRMEMSGLKRNLGDHQSSHMSEHLLLDIPQHAGIKLDYYDDILSPDQTADLLSPGQGSLSDDVLSEEYRKLFGKPPISGKPTTTKQNVTTKTTTSYQKDDPVIPVLKKNIHSKSLLEDQAFLENFKLKVQHRETTGLSCEVKKQTTDSLEQELEDRKFLQNCKKKLEEKSKQSVEDFMRFAH